LSPGGARRRLHRVIPRLLLRVRSGCRRALLLLQLVLVLLRIAFVNYPFKE